MYVQFHGMTMTCMHVLKLLDVENLTNKNKGTYYGEVNDWKPSKQSKLGVHLLYKAYQYFKLHQPEQMLYTDIK